MILYAILLLGLAAFLGMSLVFIGVRYRRGSLALGLGHAGIAVSGLVLLVWHIFHEPVHHLLYNNAAILFVITLGGGLVMLALREGRRPPPMIVVGMHAAMALFALLLLVSGYIHR
jgi:hypothetical protein